MSTLKDTLNLLWPNEAPARDARSAREAGARMPQSAIQQKADRTTRLVREITDQAAKERNAKIASLRKARLEREAATPVVEAPVKKARAKKA